MRSVLTHITNWMIVLVSVKQSLCVLKDSIGVRRRVIVSHKRNMDHVIKGVREALNSIKKCVNADAILNVIHLQKNLTKTNVNVFLKRKHAAQSVLKLISKLMNALAIVRFKQVVWMDTLGMKKNARVKKLHALFAVITLKATL